MTHGKFRERGTSGIPIGTRYEQKSKIYAPARYPL